MEKPIFNNRQNEIIEHDGKPLWISRATAIVGTICTIVDNVPYFLIAQRGEGAADYKGMWNLPCGYLDWDENSFGAFNREIWEETGLNVIWLMSEGKILHDYSMTPWDVNTNPNENRQNVVLHHGLLLESKTLEPPCITNEAEEDEVSDARWVPLHEICNYQFAFEHDKKIEKFCKMTGLVKTSVCVLLQNEAGEYLAVSRKYDKNLFGLPGGKLDDGETLEEAIVRETKEETNLDIYDIEKIDTRIYGISSKTTYVQNCFVGKWKGEILPQEELDKLGETGVVKWVDKSVLENGFFGDYNKLVIDLVEKQYSLI